MNRVGILSGEIQKEKKKTTTLLNRFTQSFRYTVKKTGETFRSHHKDHKQAYAEYLTSKNKEECDSFENE